MLTPELKKLREYLAEDKRMDIDIDMDIDRVALLEELDELNDLRGYFESLSLSGGVCPTCGRKL